MVLIVTLDLRQTQTQKASSDGGDERDDTTSISEAFNIPHRTIQNLTEPHRTSVLPVSGPSVRLCVLSFCTVESDSEPKRVQL